MKTQKTIAIIGATGVMGSAIASSLSKGDNRLLLMSSAPEKLSDLKDRLIADGTNSSIDTISCSREASWEADIIIVATPYEEQDAVAARIREFATGKIVISVSNPINSHYSELAMSADTSAAEELQKRLPHSKVVKTFNTVFASKFMSTRIDGKSADAFIAGNNGNAVETVSDLLRAVGFNPVVAGDLTASRTLERMQLLLVRLEAKHNQRQVVNP